MPSTCVRFDVCYRNLDVRFQCKVKREFTPNVNIFYALSKQRLQKSSIVLIIIFVWTVSHIIAMIKHQNNHAYIDDTRYNLVLYM